MACSQGRLAPWRHAASRVGRWGYLRRPLQIGGYAPVFTSIVEAGGLILYPFEETRKVCEVLALDLKSFMRRGLLAPH